MNSIMEEIEKLNAKLRFLYDQQRTLEISGTECYAIDDLIFEKESRKRALQQLVAEKSANYSC